MSSLPTLRSLEIFPRLANGKKIFCFRDPDGYQDEPLYLSEEATFIALMLNGDLTKNEVQTFFSKRFGSTLEEKDFEQVIEILEEFYLLETEHFFKHKARLDAAFDASLTRDAYFSGRGYPKDPQKLKNFINQFYFNAKGPGLPSEPSGDLRLSALAVPHIDFYRGGWCYAHAYKKLAENVLPKRILLIGVAHAGNAAPFIFCRKSFRTPLGELPLDKEALAKIESSLGPRAFTNERLHRTEHSIEFQAVWLSHLYQNKAQPLVTALLAASFDCKEGAMPDKNPVIAKTLRVLKQLYSDKDSMVLASVDLSHIGPRFGDTQALNEQTLTDTQNEDRALIEQIVKGDPQIYWKAINRDSNSRKICAITALYTLLKIIEPSRGRCLAYGQGLDPAGGLVSFASLAFTRN